ncbi:MAG: hypothetical protein CMA12_00165 [Euryarchaeota archaeon]|nr:hypothetical protein [Euryarchaeota archaeon]OUU12190.1 MAG: hypothetical protein CBB94_00535 [Gammaproteobacteria bacterium TMED34]
MIIKKILKYSIFSFLGIFIKQKYKFYCHDFRFLGHLINFMHIKSCNNKLNKIIFIPSQLLGKKNPYLSYKIFLHAYNSIYKKNIPFFENLIFYIYFRCGVGLKKNIRLYYNWEKDQIKRLSKIKKIFFEPNIKKKNNKKIENIINSKYILFSNRDSAFKKKIHPLEDFSYHDYRNEKLSTYEKAIKKYNKYSNSELFVRFGSIVDKKITNKKIFNYPQSHFRSEDNDLLLMKNCYFYAGTGSGPDMLALNYQKPIVYINWHHIPNLYCFRGNIIVIFKKIFNLSTNKFLTFSSLMDPNFRKSHSNIPVGLYNKSIQYKNAKLKIINNSSDEIYNAMIEMDLLLRKKLNFNVKNQNLFRKKFLEYTGKKIPNNLYVSEYFIKKNKKLFL